MSVPSSPLVLIPGLLCSDALFAPQRTALNGEFACQIGRVTRGETLEQMADHILRQTPEKFALAGLSLGGYVAFEILRQAPERVTHLALLNTNARADRADQIAQREVLSGLARTLGVRAVQAILLPFLLGPKSKDNYALRQTVLGMAETVGRAAFERQQAAIIARPDNRAFLPEIRVPTRIIVGEDDNMTPVKVAKEMHDGIPGSTLTVIPECGHLSTLEQPDAVTTALRDWLA